MCIEQLLCARATEYATHDSVFWNGKFVDGEKAPDLDMLSLRRALNTQMEKLTRELDVELCSSKDKPGPDI